MNQTSERSSLPKNTSTLLELFDRVSDQPTAIVLIPRGCDPLSIVETAMSGQILKIAPSMYVLRGAEDSSLTTLEWLYGEWDQSTFNHGSHRLTILSRILKPTATANLGSAAILEISDPACFPLANIFFPSVYRTKEFSIHAHLHSIGLPAASNPDPSGDAKSLASTAIRWTINGQAQVFFMRSPTSLPLAMLHSLLLAGTKTLASWTVQNIQLAGPVAVPHIDPRLNCTEWNFGLTIRKKTLPLTILLPYTVGRQLETLCPGNLTQKIPDHSPDSALTGLLALNRRWLDNGASLLLQDLDSSDDHALACFIADNVQTFSARDLTFLVQNYLVPLGTEAILDFFFPRDSYDPVTWSRISQALGEKLSQNLAQALKAGKNHERGLTADSAHDLLKAVASKRLELGPRGDTLIRTVLGQAINGESRKALEHLIALGIPGKLLERIPPGERMKAMAKLTDRERSMAFYGDRNAVLMLMEAFSQKGKQRELDDFDLIAKAVERGDIDDSVLIQAKTEACQFIAEHAISTNMAKAPDADWKALRAKLKPETLIFLLENPGSCLVENPLRPKLSVGLAPIEIKLLKEKVLATIKSNEILPMHPGIMHLELVQSLAIEPTPKV